MSKKMEKWQEFVSNTNFMNNQNYIISKEDKYIAATSKREMEYINSYILILSLIFWICSIYLILILTDGSNFGTILMFTAVAIILIYYFKRSKSLLKWKSSLVLKKYPKTWKLFYHGENYTYYSRYSSNIEEAMNNNLDKFLIIPFKKNKHDRTRIKSMKHISLFIIFLIFFLLIVVFILENWNFFKWISFKNRIFIFIIICILLYYFFVKYLHMFKNTKINEIYLLIVFFMLIIIALHFCFIFDNLFISILVFTTIFITFLYISILIIKKFSKYEK